MTDREIWHLLFGGGKYSEHYLIHLHHDTAGDIYVVNNNEAITYGGHTYAVSNFEYSRPDINGAGGSLSITLIDNLLTEWIENADATCIIEVVGVLVENEVQRVRGFKHFHGSVSYSNTLQAEFTLQGDDRQDMTFTPYVYDTDNNPGNA